jgi:hypothetical protein
VKVRFDWFWADFNEKDNFFVDLLKEFGHNVEVTSSAKESVDLEIISVFAPARLNFVEKINRYRSKKIVGSRDVGEVYNIFDYPTERKSSRRIWFTGENIRPPVSPNYDGFLSFDQDTYKGINAYTPLWLLDTGILKPTFSPNLGKIVQVSDLLTERRIRTEKPKFACAFVGNAHPVRIRALQEMAEIGGIDLYGPAFGKSVKNKFEIAKEYKFQFCFENDLYPGYVTEKLINAYLCDNVPLYWGDLGKGDTFNRKAFLNLADYDGIETFSQYISEISKVRYREFYEQKLINKIPNLQDIYHVLIGKIV